jgi:hypothetical protein
MGLDMYLYADKYVSRKDYSNYNYNSDSEPPVNPAFDQIVSSLKADKLIDNEWSGMTVSLPIGYWRKANAIHAWIVDNCAGGVDECQRIGISKDKAEELVSICKEVIKNKSKAKDLLSPQAGFFFGSLDIDEYYIQDLKRTVEIFEKVLKAAERGEIDSVTYQASW